MRILNQRANSGVESFEVAEGLIMTIFDKVYAVLKPRTTSGVGEETEVEVFDRVEGIPFLPENATSPNKLTAALTDEKGALVSISPTSALGESKESERPFTPMLLFLR